jgi:predicted dehydrogenase
MLDPSSPAEALEPAEGAMPDYTQRPFSFKVKKALRYTRMYGPRRTLSIIRGQYNMKRTYETLPPTHETGSSSKHVGVIGCGIFGFGVIGYFLQKSHGSVIRGVLDTNANRAASFFQRYGLDYYTTDPDKLLNDPAIDLIYIASNHLSHAEYAIRALENGKAVHIEKPHVVTESQLRRLCATMVRTGGKVRLGYNRPRSPLGQRVKAELSGQTGPAMLAWAVAGAPLPPDHWYYKPEEGGRVVGNLCHYIDFIYQMAPPEKRFPITITPTKFDRPDENIAVTMLFGDGSLGAMTFSTKGEPFEGDKERFSAHRDACLIALDDFHRLVIENGPSKKVITPFIRDHGHDANMSESYAMVRPKGQESRGADVAYVWETGLLMLKVKEALDKGEVVRIERGYDESCLAER